MTPITIAIVGLRTVSEANMREHHMVKARRKRQHTDVARMYVLAASRCPHLCQGCVRDWTHPPDRFSVTMTRVGAKRLDSDNLAGAMKGVRDGVSLALGRDDGDERIEWRYLQRCERKQNGIQVYSVEIRIASEAAPVAGLPGCYGALVRPATGSALP